MKQFELNIRPLFYRANRLGLWLAVAGLLSGACTTTTTTQTVDKQATEGTISLYENLKKNSQKGFMFGHQEDDAYGVHWVAEKGRSDVKEICGAYPAIHGWDIGKEGSERNLDGVLYDNIREWIKEAYLRGGINTVSWHVDNPVTEGNSWDTTRAVSHILPGGKDHTKYLSRLDKVAAFFNSCAVGTTKVPIIFRPFHEHNGDWFWWGKGLCTEQEYIDLWKFTVNYLRDTKGLHHLLYAFSPDRSRMDLDAGASSYLYGYPGDEYVDIIGFDNYMDVGIKWNQKSPAEQQTDLIKSLEIVAKVAKDKGKVAAFTETGLEGVTNAQWFTEVILNPIKANPNIKLAYIMVWRNANETHHYAPYVGHSSAADFLKFYEDEFTLFENDFQNPYQSY